MNSVYQQVRDTMRDRSEDLERIKLSIMSSIGTLIYSEFLRNFKQSTSSVGVTVEVPRIEEIRNILKPDGEFATLLTEKLIDDVAHKLTTMLAHDYDKLPGALMFREENRDILKTIFTLHMMPEICRQIPALITQKFSLGRNKVYVESYSGKPLMFDGNFKAESYLDFLSLESYLQFLLLLPGVRKEVTPYLNNHNNQDILFPAGDDPTLILSVSNQNAISIVHFHRDVIADNNVFPLLSFVTSTTFKEDRMEICGTESVRYFVDSSPYNRVIITKFHGVESDFSDNNEQ